MPHVDYHFNKDLKKFPDDSIEYMIYAVHNVL